ARVALDYREVHRDFDTAEIPIRFGAHLLELGELRGESIGSHPQRRPAVADRDRVLERALHGADAAGTDMNRRVRLLRRFGIREDRRKLDELALERGRGLGP